MKTVQRGTRLDSQASEAEALMMGGKKVSLHEYLGRRERGRSWTRNKSKRNFGERDPR